jgi:hypothetical protein
MVVWLGALVPTGVLTFAFLWLFKKLIASRISGLLLANALSLILSTIIGAFGFAHGEPPVFAESFIKYLVPQFVWLVVTAVIVRGQAAKQTKG